MNRSFYFIGIAFFGMINGIFNQLALIFTLLYVQLLAGPLLFVVQNQLNVVARIMLDENLASGRVVRRISDRALDVPTTAADLGNLARPHALQRRGHRGLRRSGAERRDPGDPAGRA